MKYRKKPIEVEAFKFDLDCWTKGFVIDSVKPPLWAIEAFQDDRIFHSYATDLFYVETSKGIMRINDGDYIIKGIHNELYPCEPNIFEKTYDLVAEEEL